MKTSSKLHSFTSTANLYEELNLKRKKNKSKAIIKRFDYKQIDGSQVKIIILHIHQLTEQTRSRLATAFPNVTRVITGKNNPFETRVQNEDLRLPMSRWINTLETYNGYEDWPEILGLLRYNIFPRLMKLNLSFDYTYLPIPSGFHPLYFSPYIKNAPTLTELTLFQCDASLELLEEIHASCPYIKSLRFDTIMMVVGSFELPQQIVPATSVVRLEIHNAVSFDRNGLLLDYIVIKYTNLQMIALNLVDDIQRIDEKLYDLYPSYFYESGSDNDSDNGGDADNEVYDRYRSDCYSGLRFYRSSSSKFFSRLPKTIKMLKMDLTSFNGILEEDSNQLQIIHKITSLTSLDILISSAMQKYNPNFISTNVTRLTIKCVQGPLHLGRLLEIFPSLEILSITNSECDIEGVDPSIMHSPQIHSNLRVLYINQCSIHPKVMGFFKTAAPNITRMNLSTVHIFSELNGGAYHIDLSGCNLKEFNMQLPSVESSTNLESYHQFTIQTSTKDLLHASLGDKIALKLVDGVFLEKY
ncbi:hypothetical protein K501DRAFT_287693, partial [Backusella circina FSU 941]